MNPTDREKAHAARVLALSRLWGVPTENIYSQVQYGAKNIFTNNAPRLSTQYFTFDPAGKINHSITDRYEDTYHGYSGSMVYDKKYLGTPANTSDTIPKVPLLSKATMEYGGRLPAYIPYEELSPVYDNNSYHIPAGLENAPIAPLQVQPMQAQNTTAAPAAKSPTGISPGKTSLSLGPAIIGMNSLINQTYNAARQGDEQARQLRRRGETEIYHPYQYGNGSEVLYRQGGKVPGKSIRQISVNMFSRPVMEFNGPRHEEGGIPLQYGNQQVEVEGDETGYISQTGDMHVFGNLVVPGTRMKFKTASKKLAAAEIKANRQMARAGKILEDVEDPDDPFQAAHLNSGMVQAQAATRQQAALTWAKENLGHLQESMLQYAAERGIAPDQLFGTARYGKKIAPDGITLPARRSIDPWALPEIPEPVLQGARMANPAAGLKLDKINTINRMEFTGKDQAIKSTAGKLQQTIPKTVTPLPAKDELYAYQTPTYNDPLSFGQIAPEIFTLGTNRVDTVPFQHFTPALYTPYQVSYRDQLQENNATFKALVGSMRANAPALSQLAANKYQADAAVLGSEYRANQAARNQVTNQNTELLNQAQLQNLAFAERAETAKGQNEAATRATTREALRSISAKALQQKATNANRTLMNQMIPNYRYDPATMQWTFAGGQAPIMVNGFPIYSPANSPALFSDQENTTYQRDAKGQLVTRSRSKTPGLLRLFQ